MTISLTAVDAQSGVARTEFRVDGGVWVTYIDPIQLRSDGTHIIEYHSIDMSGNVEAVLTSEVRIDCTCPVLVITMPTAGSTLNSSTVTLIWSCIEECSGIECCEYSVDGGTWQSCGLTTSLTISDLEDGNHTIAVRGVDLAGNEGKTSVSVRVLTAQLPGPGDNPPGSEESDNYTMLVVAGGVGAVLAGVALVALLLQRKKRQI